MPVSMIDLRQLECFCAVVRSGSVSRAAAALGISQPALSRQIQRLEENVGSQLLYRNGRGVMLTAGGMRFHESAAELIDRLKDACQTAAGDASQPSGTVAVGLLSSMSGLIGAPVFQKLKARWPAIKLNLVEGFSGHVHEWLLAGRLDLAILHDACHSPSIAVEHLLSEDLFLVGRDVPQTPGLDPNKETIPFEDLRALRLLVTGPDHGLRREINRISADAGLSLQIESDIDSLLAQTELMHRGFGYGILPIGCVYRAIAEGSLKALRIVRPNIVNRLVLTSANNRPMSAAMREVRAAIREEIALVAQQQRGWTSVGSDDVITLAREG